MATLYMNRDTGELFTLDELKKLWEQFWFEMKFDNFEEFIDSLYKEEGAEGA